MKIVVSPNPYRDKQFKNARQACSILREAGAEVALCLPFDVDKTFEIPHDLRFQDIQKEIKTADMLICFGVAGAMLFQMFINIGMCIGITPVIGITLPFFSYGGSSMVTMFCAMGLVSGVKYKPKPEHFALVF